MKNLSIRAKYLLAALLPTFCMGLALLTGGRLLNVRLDNSSLLLLSASLLLAAAVAYGSGALLSRLVSRRFERLVESASLVSSGLYIQSTDNSRDELGQLAAVLVATSHEVSDQKAELIQISTRLEAILRASQDVCILAEDNEGRITFCNPGAERLLGYRQVELMGRQLKEIVHPPLEMRNRAASISLLAAARSNAGNNLTQDHENLYIRNDGQALDVQLSVTLMKDMQGRKVGLLHVAHDITPRKVLEAELRQKNELLKKQAQEYESSSEEQARVLARLQDAAVTPLRSLQRSLLSLKESLESERELGLVNHCRSMAEAALDAIGQATRRARANADPSESPTVLPAYIRRSTAQKDISVSIKAIDGWYEDNGDIPSSKQPRQERDKILIVDDFDATRAMMSVYLEGLSCDLDFAGDGMEALDKVATDTYRLVLMDIEMPRMDGNETARRIRLWENEQGRNRLPLIAMTAHAVAGNDDVPDAAWTSSLRKPLSKSQLLEALGKYVK
jgi:PAS domain S-box-containing protein